MKFDTYTLQARVVPAVVTLLPPFVLSYRLLQDPGIAALTDHVLGLKVVGTMTVGLVLLFVFAHVVRQAGLWLERRYFKAGFPTTYLLEQEVPFSDAFKEQYKNRIKQDFNIEVLGTDVDPAVAKQRLDDAARLVLKRAGAASLVEKHNAWYGLYRNLVGGAYWGLVLSVVNIVLCLAWLHDTPVLVASAGLAVVYGVFITCGKGLIIRHGEEFAKQAILEYVAQPT
jgi:hypothetical protein